MATVGSDSMKSLLVCGCCKVLALPPIVQCETGHSICEPCALETESCLTCKQKITTIRNAAAEEIAKKIKFRCAFWDRGCVQEALVPDLKEHQPTCLFGPVLTVTCHECLSRYKTSTVPLDDFVAHLTGHDMIVRTAESEQQPDVLKGRIDCDTSKMGLDILWPGYLFKYDDHFFVTPRGYCGLTDMIHGGFFLVGGRSEAANYSVTIKLVNLFYGWKHEVTSKVGSILDYNPEGKIDCMPNTWILSTKWLDDHSRHKPLVTPEEWDLEYKLARILDIPKLCTKK